MALRVPSRQIDDMRSAVDPGAIAGGVGFARIAKQLAVARSRTETIGLVQRVARLVPQDATAFGLAGALAFEHLRALQTHQPPVGEIEGDRKSQDAVGSKELLR